MISKILIEVMHYISFEIFKPSKKIRIGWWARFGEVVGYNPKYGRLSFYRPVLQKYITTNYVHLYYDQEKEQMGIEPVDKQDEYAVRIYGKNSKSIQIKTFLDSFSIKINEFKRIPIVYDEKNKMLLVDLKCS